VPLTTIVVRIVAFEVPTVSLALAVVVGGRVSILLVLALVLVHEPQLLYTRAKQVLIAPVAFIPLQ
jgi:hypothetical protein